MFSIGIMQGRVLPFDLKQIQVYPTDSYIDELIRIEKLGFDYVELLFDRKMQYRKYLSEVKKQIDDMDLSCVSICADNLTNFSCLNNIEQFSNMIKKNIEEASEVGINRVIVPFFGANQISTQEEFKIVLLGLVERGVLRQAHSKTISLCLETELTANDMKRILLSNKLREFKICYDLGNAQALGHDILKEIDILGFMIGHVHIKDCKLAGPNVLLGEGDVDFESALKALKKVRYPGPLILETKYFESAENEAKNNLEYINSKLG